MPANKKLISCIVGFVTIMILGTVWASSPAVELSGFQRILISFIIAALFALALFYFLKQGESLRQSEQAEFESSAARDEIAANISHEIRTPLSGILGVMHLLRRTQLDRNQLRYVDTASNSANMLLAIINDVIAYARMDSSWFPVESESLDLNEVVEDVTSILAPEAINKGLELVCDIDPKIPHRIKGDPLRLRQVLNNLLINAIRFTDQGLVAIYVVKHDGRIEIGVKDSGAGLSEAQQQLLLQPFASMDDKYEREFGAAGLGIKITRRLIEAMGSQLQIESSPGTGSRFFFELAQDAEHSDAFDWKPPQAMQDLSVAIVSPLALQRRSIINMMSHWKIAQVHEHDFDVENGGEPAELEPCDLVIVDQSETEQAVNGFIDKLRNQSAWRDTRFVHLVPQNRESEGGSADVRLLKPLSHSRLYTMMMDTIYKQAFSNEYDPAQARAEETGPDKTGKLSGRRILLAEDNDINKMIVLEMLEDTGVDVDVATNGAEAVEQVQREDYDLVLMDIQMPVVDGYEATRRIRALGGWFESIPIVAMTAHALEGDSGKSLEAGMDQHVSKPFEPDELIDLVADLVQQRRRD